MEEGGASGVCLGAHQPLETNRVVKVSAELSSFPLFAAAKCKLLSQAFVCVQIGVHRSRSAPCCGGSALQASQSSATWRLCAGEGLGLPSGMV